MTVRALAALAVLLGGPALAQEIIQHPQENRVVPRPDDAGSPGAGMPDDRPLWRLLASGEDQELERRIARLRLAYPAWTPPAAMLDVLASRGAERALQEAKQRRDWDAVRRIAAARPAMAACTRPDDAAVASAAPGAPSTLPAAYAACPTDAARAALLGAVLDRFGLDAVAPLLIRTDETTLPDPVRVRLRTARAELALQRLGTALSSDLPDALAQGDRLRGEIEERHEGGIATALGWAALRAGQSGTAITWFELGRRLDPAQPAEGLARAQAAAGEADAAQRTLAASPDSQSANVALAREIAEGQIVAAYRRGEYADAAVRAAQLSDPPILLGWSLFRLRRFDEAAAAFERRYQDHHEEAAAQGLAQSLVSAGRPAAATAAAQRYGGPVRAAIAALVPAAPRPDPDRPYRDSVARLAEALTRHDARLPDLAAELGPMAKARRDPDAATALGWAAIQREDYREATRWFALGAGSTNLRTRDDAAYGAALAAFLLGDAATAEREAARHDGERWLRLRVDAVMRRAFRLNEERAGSPDAAAAAREALLLDPSRRDAAMLLAWNDLQEGRRTTAAAAFERLYRVEPERQSAAGLAEADGASVRLDAIAAALGGPLANTLKVRRAQDAFDRKAFLAAARIDPGLDQALPGLETPRYGVNAAVRSKSGEAGTSRLTSVAEDVYAEFARGTDRFAVRVHLLSLDSGAPAAGATAPRTTRLALGAEPVLSWNREAAANPRLSPFAEIGTTPLGGAVGPTVQGQLGLGWQGDGLSLRGVLFRQSVTESILSFTGVRDAVTGRPFGRVTETGGRLEAYLQLAPRLGLYGQSSAGSRTGEGVRSNIHGAAAATLSYDLRPPGFDYLTLGPSYQFAAFQRDLSGFVPGQGGYYSPRQSHTAGAALRFQTAESRQVIVRGSVFAGWQFARSDGAGALSSTGTRPSRQDGFNSVGEITATYRLSAHWGVGGLVRYQVSPQFTDLYGGVALSYSLGRRATLVSADLPRFDLR